MKEGTRLLDSLLSLINCNDQHKFHGIYSQCLWDIVVATEEELLTAFNYDWSLNLPAALHTCLCQRLALISNDLDLSQKALAVAIQYCDSEEEQYVSLGVCK